MKDINNREYAKESEVKVGTKLEADSGFDCMDAGSIYEVSLDGANELCIACRMGTHSLSGQLEAEGDEGYYIGLYLVK